MENVKISIIIPVYNAEKYLSECLKSLLRQTLKEIEIICINDGSSDNSLSILENFQLKDSRIKIINQKNSGVAVTRNNGISLATGEFIGFVDSDDWVDEDYFEKLYNAAKKFNSDVAAGDFYRRGKILRSKKLKYKKEEFFVEPADKIKKAFIPKYNYIWNKIYKRESLLNLNIPFENGRYYEDVIWIVKIIYYLKGFVTVPDTFYHYRKTEGSIVTQKSKKHLEDRIHAESEMINFMSAHNLPIAMQCKKPEKVKISFLGINILKIEYYYPNVAKYRLFGFIPILTVTKSA